MKPPPGFAAALLAGGRSSRMGTDKAFLAIGGAPLWRSQLDLLRALGPGQLLLSANARQRFSGLDDAVELVRDRVAGCGPLGGLTACLEAARFPRLLVTAVDMPGLDEDFLRPLVEAGAPLVLRDAGGRFEPFPAVYPASAAALARESLAAGRLALQAFIGQLVGCGEMRVRGLREADRIRLRSWNRPQDLGAPDARV